MAGEQDNFERELMARAYGPEKDAWKADGNYFSFDDLARMEKDFEDLTIIPCPEQVYAAD